MIARAKRKIKKLAGNQLVKQIVSGVSWDMTCMMLGRGLMVCSGIFIARHLGKENFGLWSVVLSVFMLFTTLGSFNITAICTRFVSELRNKQPERLGQILGFVSVMVLVFGLVASITCYWTGSWIAKYLFDSPALDTLLTYAGVCVFMLLASSCFRGILYGAHLYRYGAFMYLIAAISFLFSCMGLFLFPTIGYVLFAYTFSWFFAVCYAGRHVLMFLQRSSIKITYGNILGEWELFFRYCLPSFILGSAQGPINLYSRSIIVRLPKGVGAMAGIQVASSWQTLLAFLPQVGSRVMTPVYARLRNDRKRFIKYFFVVVSSATLSAIALAIPLALASQWILRLYGEEFVEYYPVFLVLLLAGILQAIADVNLGLYVILNAMWWKTISEVLGYILFLGGALLFIPKFGAIGFAWVVVFWQMFRTVVVISVVCKKVFFVEGNQL